MIALWTSIKAAKETIVLAALALLMTLLVVQTVRIEGLRIWPLSIEGWKARSERFEAATEALAKAALDAQRAQEAVIQREQERLDTATEEAQDDYETTRVGQRDATDRFIAANGLQCEADRSGIGGDSSAAGSESPIVPETVPSYVVMDTGDVRVCGDLYTYAVEAHNWAMDIASPQL